VVAKTAIILIHGIGEQIPMATLTGFIDTVWTHDDSLVEAAKPDPNTGGTRTTNASWSKPDERNRSFELQLVTTETGKDDRRYDFFEYYWAHRITGTTWEQVRAWIFKLMLRNPITNVPRGVLPAWTLMWAIVLIFIYASIVFSIAGAEEPIDPAEIGFSIVHGTLALAAWIQSWPTWLKASAWGLLAIFSGALLKVMVDVAGDIVRYVEASPKNIAVRQDIREKGVQLLETLMGFDESGKAGDTPYDRIIVVGHSLGTIVGYDIITHAFGRHNDRIDKTTLPGCKQPQRAALESMIRDAWAVGGKEFSIDDFQKLQDECRAELNALGNPWIVSDFISIGSPLTHSEFLLATDREALELAKEKRILPTCPPTLEFDRITKKLHFSYRSRDVRGEGKTADLEAPRVPHHAAPFAYTRWTNIYSPLRMVLIGDIVSGPLRKIFGPKPPAGKSSLYGIRDVAVLPSQEGSSQDRKRRMLTHLLYWDRSVANTGEKGFVPHHIRALRDALHLGKKS
jgi:hypothetical protein